MSFPVNPIATKDLYAFLPHKPPMVWVDEVVHYEHGKGSALTVLRKEALYMDGDRLRPPSFIEFVAQAYAFVNLAYLRSSSASNTNYSKTYLAAVKDFTLNTSEVLCAGETVRMDVQRTRSFGPIAVVKGDCFSSIGKHLASCELKVFST